MATATGSHRQYRWLREAISGGSHAYEYSVLEIAADGQRCEHHGDVRFDRLALAMENRPGTQVALSHPEGCLYLPEIVVSGDDAGSVHGGDGQVGDVSLQPGSLPVLLDQVPVHAFGGSVDLDEPVLLHRPGPVGDLLSPLDHGVDRLVVVLLPLEGPLIHHPPSAGMGTGAHLPGGLQDLTVGEVVAVPLEVRGQIVGGLGDP